MRGKLVTVAAAVGMLTAACTTPGESPATAPPIPSTVSSTTSSTASVATSAPTTSVRPNPSTTVDRLAEVQAILEDLERRRLQALYDGDREAFAALFANEAYLEGSLELFDLLAFSAPPTIRNFEVNRILVDTSECLAAAVSEDYGDFVEGAEASTYNLVLEHRREGGWGFSFAGTGWLCNGPHPLG